MKRIVIADDSATARMFIQRCLEIAGCREATFVEAGNGKEVLSRLKEEPADFVVTDLNMPVMDGETLLKWMKASPSLNSIPVMIITSTGNAAKEKELAGLGAFSILAKPVSPAGLASAIGPLLKTEQDSRMPESLHGLQEIIARVVIETIENMAFMETIQTDQAPETLEERDALKSSILVHDPFPGELRLIMSKELTVTIAEILYSPVDKKNIDQLLLDILAELLNTIAGRVMAELVPHERTFRLGLPETGMEFFPKTDSVSTRYNFETEGHYFSLIACGEALLEIINV